MQERSVPMARIPWSQVLGLFGSLALFSVSLKILEFVFVVRDGGVREFLDMLRGTLAFYGAMIPLWAVFLAASSRWLGEKVALRILYGFAAVVVLVEIASFNFYCATGSALDSSLLLFGLRSSGDLAPVVSSEIGLSACALVLMIIVYRNLGVRNPFWRRFEGREEGIAPSSVAGLALAAVLLSFVACTPSLSRLETSFVRAPVINLLISSLSGRSQDLAGGEARAIETLGVSLVPTPDRLPRNVVLILLESIPAHSVTPYRPELATTPFLARLARESLVADRAYTIVPHTSKSLISILCGIEPYLDLSMVEALPGAIPARCLPKLLGDQGYRSAFFQTATRTFERRPELLENIGFDRFVGLQDLEVEGFEEVNYFGYEDRAMLRPSLEWIQEDPEKPFLLTYLTVTTHHPYRPPRSFPRRSFAKDDRLDDYLNSVAYTDRFIEEVFEGVRELGLYEDTLFLIVADHGEAFGEHGRFAHDTVVYEEGLRVPLLLHLPGRFQGGVRITKPVNHLDLLPTIVDLLGYGMEGGRFPGESLLAAESDRSLKAYCFYEFRCLAVTRGRWKYIHHFGDRPDELFDLAADPLERDDLAAANPARVQRTRDESYEWLGRVRASYRKFMENGFQAW